MKNSTLIKLLIPILALLVMNVKGQVRVGYESNTGFFPIYSSANYSYSQSIILSSEIRATGTITHLRFYYNGNNLSNSNTWYIYLGHTNKTSFGSTADWIPASNMTLVYGNTFTNPGGAGWITLNITDWSYNGTDNLVVAVNETKAGSNPNGLFLGSTLGSNRSLLWISNSLLNPSSPPSASIMSSANPNIVLDGLIPSCPTPTNLEASDISYKSATIDWIENGSATAWQLDMGNSNFRHVGGQTSNIATNGVTTDTLSKNHTYNVYVRSVCGIGDTSTWYGPVAFTSHSGKAQNPNPANLATGVNISTNQLDWDDVPLADSYLVTVGTSPGGNDIADAVSCAVSSYPLPTNLLSHSSYFWKIKTIVNGSPLDSTSEFVFTTICPTITTFPYQQSFESSLLAPGWSQVDVSGTNGNYRNISASTYPVGISPVDGDWMLEVNSYDTYLSEATRLMSCDFDISSLDSVGVSFWMFHDAAYQSNYDKIQPQVFTGGSWVNIGSPIFRNVNVGWKKHEIDLSNYSGIIKVGFLATSGHGNNMYIDMFEIYESSTIVPPTNLSTSSISQTSASLSWTEQGTATVWEIEYGQENYQQGLGITVNGINSIPYSLSGLFPVTNYDFYVRSVENGKRSDWSGPFTFTTTSYESSEVSGKLTPCSPVYHRTNQIGAQQAGMYTYDYFAFTVDVSGKYKFEANWINFDGYLHLYENDFDPENPEVNWLASDDYNTGDSNSLIDYVNLQEGTLYYIVGSNSINEGNGSRQFGNATYKIYGASIIDLPNNSILNGKSPNPRNAIPSTDGVYRMANYQCLDTLGWTHYYIDPGTSYDVTDDYLLLSVELSGNNIGEVGNNGFSVIQDGNSGVSFIQSPYTNFFPGWWVFNRYWVLNPVNQPTTAVKIRNYFTESDFESLQEAIRNDGGIAPESKTDMSFFKINSVINNYDPNPANGHQDVPTAVAFNGDGAWIYTNNVQEQNSNWTLGSWANGYYAEIRVGHFSGGGGGAAGNENDGTLPLSLTDFRVENKGLENLITWITISEINTSYHVVERCEKIGGSILEVNTLPAQGFSNTIIEYSTRDKEPPAEAYYRLRSVDNDGATSFSNWIFAEAKHDEINVYPCIAKEIIYVDFNGQESVTVDIINCFGLKSTEAISNYGLANQIRIDVSGLTPGVYFARVIINTETILKSFIKE